MCRQSFFKEISLAARAPQENNGDFDWNVLLADLYDDVLHFALKLCRSRTQAEDLAQEAFLRAWRFHHTLRDANVAKAWLFAILRNENNRHFERRRIHFHDLDQISATAALDSEPDRRAESHLLQRAIFELGEHYREPLIMQVFGGYTGKEIAARLNLNGNTVMTRLFRARAKLYRKFEPESPPRNPRERSDLSELP